MKQKAINNLDSAQILIDSKQYTSSVHCSYYAVFQYMKYMLDKTTKRPITLAEQDSHNGDSSHEYILLEIQNRIDRLKEARNLSQKVRLLKSNRVNADYSIREFSDIESIECRDLANGIITNLKTYFGNI